MIQGSQKQLWRLETSFNVFITILATANIKNIANINTTLKSAPKPFAEILSVNLDTPEHVNMDKAVNFYKESVASTNMKRFKSI